MYHWIPVPLFYRGDHSADVRRYAHSVYVWIDYHSCCSMRGCIWLVSGEHVAALGGFPAHVYALRYGEYGRDDFEGEGGEQVDGGGASQNQGTTG